MTHAGETPGHLAIAYQGEPGAFSELAILDAWGSAARPVACPEFADVVRAVDDGSADFGLLPVENSIAGRVEASVAAIDESPLHVVGAIEHPIRLCLLAPAGATLESLRSVESHPVALAQCARFLRAHPRLETRPVFDTAGAARLVAAARDTSRAAVASSRAAELHALTIVRAGIEDHAGNVTRFAVLARDRAARPSALDSTRPGVMLDA